jgi:hypothetical protein
MPDKADGGSLAGRMPSPALYMTPSDYLRDRVDDQIEWYTRKSSLNKRWFIRLTGIEILLSVSIPFLTDFITADSLGVKHLVSLVGICLALNSGLLVLMKYKDNWVAYRTTAERLRHERCKYLTRTGIYAGEDRFVQFVSVVEEVLTQEIAAWKSSQAPSKEAAGTTPVAATEEEA